MQSFTLYRQRTLRIPVVHSFIADTLASLEDISANVNEHANHHQISVVYGMLKIQYLLLEPNAFNRNYSLINQNTGTLIHSSSSLFKTLLHIFENLRINYGG